MRHARFKLLTGKSTRNSCIIKIFLFSLSFYIYKCLVTLLGSKWTLRQLRKYFDKMGVDDYYLWQRIWSILVLTIIGDGRNFSRIESADKSFEFLGFDILVDENLKPNLLEVSPTSYIIYQSRRRFA